MLSRPLKWGSWALVNTELCAPVLIFTIPAFLFTAWLLRWTQCSETSGTPQRVQPARRDILPNLTFVSLVEPLTSVTVHWNVITAISLSTSVSFRLNLETNDNGSLIELFWNGGWENGEMSLISVASVLGFLWFVFFFNIDCVTCVFLDYLPLGRRISPKAQYFK